MYLPMVTSIFSHSHLFLLIYDRLGNQVTYIRTTQGERINWNLDGHFNGFVTCKVQVL